MKLIFDGNNLAVRCNYVTDLYTSNGIRTSAIAGTLNSIYKLIDILSDKVNEPVSDVIVVWDYGKSERRKKLLPEYKGQRHKNMDEEAILKRKELLLQMDYLYLNLPAFGVRSIRIKGQEADDLAYALKLEYENLGNKEKLVYITNDEDYLQLVDDICYIWSPIKELLITDKNFEEIVGLPIKGLVEYKALVGDKSDNIPGVRGIGEKIGKELINKYGTIDNLVKDIDTLKKGKRLLPLLQENIHNQLDINLQMIDFKYVDCSEIKDIIHKKITDEISLDKKKVMKILKQNQLVDIMTRLESFLKTFRSLENTRIKNF